MAILIKGMEMPKSCRECRFCNGQANTDYGVCAWCNVDGKVRDAYTMQDCPLVPVPPHGRLIDADALMGRIEHDTPLSSTFEKIMRRYIEKAPTIIESTIGQLNSDSAVNEAEEGE